MESFLRIIALLVVFFGVVFLQYNRPQANFGQKNCGCSCFAEESVVTELSEPVESLSQELESLED